jgi:hypothetical protein
VTSLYAFWSDNLALDATTITPTNENVLYPVTKTYNGNPASGAQFTASTMSVVYAFASPVFVALPVLIHSSLDATDVPRMQGHTADSWGTPDVNQPFAIAAVDASGYVPNAYIDMETAHGSAATKAYWRFVQSTASANGNVKIGELFLGSTRRVFPRGFHVGYSDAVVMRNIEHITDGQVSNRSKMGFARRIIIGSIIGTRAETDTIIAWFETLTGRADPMVIVPDITRADAYLGLWDSDEMVRLNLDGDVYEVTVPFRELSRGLVW